MTKFIPSATKLRRLCFYTCVCPQGVCLSACWDTTPRSRHPPLDGYCCGRYTSYWNAFLSSFLSQKMSEVKEWLLDEENHSQSNCLILTVISHGTADECLTDLRKNRAWIIEDLISRLSKMDTLQGKPKVLVIQACRGGK